MKKIAILILLNVFFLTGCNQKTESTTSSTTAIPSVNVSEASTVQATLSIGAKEVAKCSVIDNQIQRLSCYDSLATKYGQVATTKNTTTETKGGWVTATDFDPLTDKAVHRARLVAQVGRGRHGDEIVLRVRCSNGKTEAYIDWSTFLGSDDIEVTSRIDKAQPQKLKWSLSTDHKASFMPQSAMNLKKFIGASTYIVNLTPYSENPITAIFDVSGADEAFKDIRQECKW